MSSTAKAVVVTIAAALLLIAPIVVAVYTQAYKDGYKYGHDTVNPMDYVKANDQGCDEIVALPTRLVCVVQMDAGDDALYIIKRDGAKDDF